MYTLTLTESERRAIDWVNYRYWCGFDLRHILCSCYTEHTEVSWHAHGDVTYTIPEHKAWDILEIARQECGDELFCPCLDDKLSAKLIGLVLSIV